MMEKKRVLILCTANSCRSQMAEGLLRHDFGQYFDVASAGTAPAFVHPRAIAALDELGIDISTHHAKHVDTFISDHFDLVITVCDNAKESCPSFPNAGTTVHWPFDDPAVAQGSEADITAEFRRIRDAIRQRFQDEFASQSARSA